LLWVLLINGATLSGQGQDVILRIEGEVEHDLDEVRLNGVIAFIIVIILDEVVASIVKVRRVVLEVLLVLLVGEDVIAVSTLDLSVLLLLGLRGPRLLVTYLLELLKAIVILGGEVHDLSRVALLENGPLEIIFINGLEVVR
jgi:hypothetical protein